MAESLDKPIEMHILGNEEPRGEDVNVAKLCTQDLPSRLARHSSTTVIHQAALKRKYHRTSMKRSSGLSEVTSQGGTLHIMQRENEIKPLDLVSTSQEMLTSVDFKAVPLPLSVRRHFKRSLKAKTSQRLSLWKAFILEVTMKWSRFRSGIKELLYSLELWRGHLKDIEGQFGSGVVSYFIFLRWLMFLNLFVFLMAFGFVSLPTLIICARTRVDDTQGNSTRAGSCKHELVYSTEINTEHRFHGVVLDFITGQGWISDTIMFYSSYPSDAIISQEGVKYHLPLAYLLTGGACLLFCFVMMVQNASIGFREGYIESEGAFNSFSNHLFSAWDYCICEKDAALQKKRILAQDIHFELDEEARLKRAQNRTKK